MALSYIQMPVDGAGKQVQAWVNALGPGNLYTEAVTITDSTGIEKATASNPLRVDPTGTTVQPVLDAATSATGSGVPSDASYQGLNVSGTLRGITGVNPTGSVYAAQMDLSSVGGTSISLGQAVAASSIPVVLPSGTNVPVTGTVTVTQATGTNLHAVIDSGTITTVSTVTAVTAITNALPAGSNIIGKVDILGNAGIALDAVLGAAKPANVLQVGGNDGTNAYAVPLASGGGSVIVSGSVTIGANSSVNLAQVNGVTTLTGAGASGTGAQRVTVSQDTTTIAGSAPGTAGSASANVISVQGVASMTPVQTTTVPATSGGLSVYHVVSAGSTNAANIKVSAGQLYGVSIYNATTYPVYAKLYNTAGTPTVGTGVIQTFGCQAGTQTQIPITQGIPYATGIGISITKGIADGDATAVAANDCVVEVYYK